MGHSLTALYMLSETLKTCCWMEGIFTGAYFKVCVVQATINFHTDEPVFITLWYLIELFTPFSAQDDTNLWSIWRKR